MLTISDVLDPGKVNVEDSITVVDGSCVLVIASDVLETGNSNVVELITVVKTGGELGAMTDEVDGPGMTVVPSIIVVETAEVETVTNGFPGVLAEIGRVVLETLPITLLVGRVLVMPEVVLSPELVKEDGNVGLTTLLVGSVVTAFDELVLLVPNSPPMPSELVDCEVGKGDVGKVVLKILLGIIELMPLVEVVETTSLEEMLPISLLLGIVGLMLEVETVEAKPLVESVELSSLVDTVETTVLLKDTVETTLLVGMDEPPSLVLWNVGSINVGTIEPSSDVITVDIIPLVELCGSSEVI